MAKMEKTDLGKEQRRLYQGAYYAKNKKHIKAKSNAYYAENKEDVKPKKRAYYAKNKESIKVKQRIRNAETKESRRYGKLMQGYSLSVSQWLKMYDAQMGCCSICGKNGKSISDISAKREEILHVDHCHESGKVRGLLCGYCNTALGLFGDSVKSLENAINYLKYFASERSDVQHEQKRALLDADIGTVYENRLPLPTGKLLKNVNLIRRLNYGC